MKINHNLSALSAYRNLSVNNTNSASSLEKLSSGLRINRASDDAAGLAISEKMRSQIRGLEMAERNTLDGVSFVQTAEGALSSVHDMLQRMRELSVQAANDSNTKVDRDAIQQEINQLTNEVNRISNATEFNTKKLLDGSLSDEVTTITTGAKAVTPVQGVYTIDLSTAFAAGETITIDGETFKAAGAGGTDLANGFFKSDTTTNQATALKEVIDANPILSAKYTVTVSTNDIILTQKTGSSVEPIISDTGIAADATLALATLQKYTIGLSAPFSPTETITIDGVAFTAGTDFNVTSATTQSSTLKTAIEANPTLSAKYTVTDASPDIILTQKVGGLSALTISDTGTTANATASSTNTTAAGVTEVKAVRGIYQFHAGSSDITIDGVKLKYDEEGVTGWDDAYALRDKINADTTLSVNYTASVVDGKIQLTQKSTKETETAPKLSNNSLVALQIGANQGQTVSLELKNMQAVAIGISRIDSGGEKEITLSNGKKLTVWYTATKQANDGVSDKLIEYTVDVSSHEKAAAAITVFEDAITRVSAERSRLGAVQNRLDHTVDNLKYMAENVTASESRIRDLDMALEMTTFTKNNILVQSAQAMLAQANQLPQGVLQLLQ